MMKTAFASFALGLALAFSASSYASGDMGNMSMGSTTMQSTEMKESMSHGEIRKVDLTAGKLTIKHGPLENLGMEAMTMVFKVKDPAMLSQVKVGDKIDFVAEEVNGALTVVKLQKQ